MRMFQTNKRLFSAELWDWRDSGGVSPDGDPVPVLYFRRTIKFDYATSPATARSRALSDEPMNLNARLVNIKDRHGNLVMPADTSYTVTGCVPSLNAFGEAEGYVVNLALDRIGEFKYADEEED